jgi:hypothetical protein
MSETKLLLRSYQNVYFSDTDAFEQINVIYPLTSGSINVSQQSVKVQFEIPNLLSIKLDDIWIECNYTPGFSSTSGSDTWTSLQPSFVPWRGPSSIERITLTIGSNTALDYYGNALMNNLVMNLQNNSITRNNLQFMGGSGQFQGTSSPQPMFTRFKLRYSPLDHLNQQGLIPCGKMAKMVLSLYYTPASFVMYCAQAAVGTVTLNYTIDNLQLQLREVAGPTVNRALSNGLAWCSREWYFQSLSISNASSQSIQVPTNFKYLRGLIFVFQRIQDLQDITPTGITNLSNIVLKFRISSN